MDRAISGDPIDLETQNRLVYDSERLAVRCSIVATDGILF